MLWLRHLLVCLDCFRTPADLESRVVGSAMASVCNGHRSWRSPVAFGWGAKHTVAGLPEPCQWLFQLHIIARIQGSPYSSAQVHLGPSSSGQAQQLRPGPAAQARPGSSAGLILPHSSSYS